MGIRAIPPFFFEPTKGDLSTQLGKYLEEMLSGGSMYPMENELMKTLNDVLGYKEVSTRTPINIQELIAGLTPAEKQAYDLARTIQTAATRYVPEREGHTDTMAGYEPAHYEDYITAIFDEGKGLEWLNQNIPESRRYKEESTWQPFGEGEGPTTDIGKMLASAEGMIGDILSGDTGEDSLLRKWVVEPARRRLMEDVLPEIGASYGKGGAYFGTHRAAAENEARMDTEANINEMIAGLQQNAMQTGLTYPTGKIATALSLAQYPRDVTGEITDIINTYLSGGQAPIVYDKTSKKMQLAQMGVGNPTSMCCWIFIEGEGSLTETVRKFRDEHFGENGYIAKGYKKMAKWLVPAMKRNWFVKKLVQWTMTKPLTYCAKHYGKYKALLAAPLGFLWVFVWSTYGKFGISQRSLHA